MKVQSFVAEMDSRELLKKYLRLAITTVLDAHEEIAIKLVETNGNLPNLDLPPALYDHHGQVKHFPVILIGGWYLPKPDQKEHLYFGDDSRVMKFRRNGAQNAVDGAVDCINALLMARGEMWRQQFVKKCGNGYHDAFLPFDGHVETGYELRSCDCFPQKLAISLVHIYYGK